MSDQVFESATDRIHYSEAVDYLQQGRAHLVRSDLVELYLRKGLWTRSADGLHLTDEGRRQHEQAVRERFSDG
ncbi:MAG TPA: hypothetical protein VJ743_13260 [Albitalea sp.]|nr:hypothetical protein [Albitalea sp.]